MAQRVGALAALLREVERGLADPDVASVTGAARSRRWVPTSGQ